MSTPNTRSFQMGTVFTHARKIVSDNPQLSKILNKVLKNPNLTSKYVRTILKRLRPTRRETIENINNKMYDEAAQYDNVVKNCKNYFRRLDINHNTDKVDEQKMNNFLKNCEQFNIYELCQKEKKLNILLDNYSVHHSAYTKEIAEILNINLIPLPAYSPDLNPIEDIWRIIKKFVSNKFIETGKDIVNLYITKFHEEVKNSSLYDNWVDEFLGVCFKS
jgi:transposase